MVMDSSPLTAAWCQILQNIVCFIGLFCKRDLCFCCLMSDSFGNAAIAKEQKDFRKHNLEIYGFCWYYWGTSESWHWRLVLSRMCSLNRLGMCRWVLYGIVDVCRRHLRGCECVSRVHCTLMHAYHVYIARLWMRITCLQECVTWLIRMCDVTHSYVWHECVSRVHVTHMNAYHMKEYRNKHTLVYTRVWVDWVSHSWMSITLMNEHHTHEWVSHSCIQECVFNEFDTHEWVSHSCLQECVLNEYHTVNLPQERRTHLYKSVRLSWY